MRMLLPKLTFYISPWSLVIADRPTRAFLVTAEQEKKAWHARLRSIFFGSARMQRYFGLKGPDRKTKSPELKMLEFHGILVLGGKHIFPNRWPDSRAASERTSLVGQTFGRLTVLEDLPQRRHRCQCICGATRSPLVPPESREIEVLRLLSRRASVSPGTLPSTTISMRLMPPLGRSNRRASPTSRHPQRDTRERNHRGHARCVNGCTGNRAPKQA